MAPPPQGAAVQTLSIGPSAAMNGGGMAPSTATSKDLPQTQEASPLLYVPQDSPLIIESGTKSGGSFFQELLPVDDTRKKC